MEEINLIAKKLFEKAVADQRSRLGQMANNLSVECRVNGCSISIEIGGNRYGVHQLLMDIVQKVIEQQRDMLEQQAASDFLQKHEQFVHTIQYLTGEILEK